MGGKKEVTGTFMLGGKSNMGPFKDGTLRQTGGKSQNFWGKGKGGGGGSIHKQYDVEGEDPMNRGVSNAAAVSVGGPEGVAWQG